MNFGRCGIAGFDSRGMVAPAVSYRFPFPIAAVSSWKRRLLLARVQSRRRLFTNSQPGLGGACQCRQNWGHSKRHLQRDSEQDTFAIVAVLKRLPNGIGTQSFRGGLSGLLIWVALQVYDLRRDIDELKNHSCRCRDHVQLQPKSATDEKGNGAHSN